MDFMYLYIARSNIYKPIFWRMRNWLESKKIFGDESVLAINSAIFLQSKIHWLYKLDENKFGAYDCEKQSQLIIIVLTIQMALAQED